MNVVVRVETFTCPCCGGFIGEAAPVEFVLGHGLSESHRKIFSRLSTRLGAEVSSDTLIDTLYSDREDGGPIAARLVLSQLVHTLNKRIEAHGWIVTSRGRGRGNQAVYRLIPREARQ